MLTYWLVRGGAIVVPYIPIWLARPVTSAIAWVIWLATPATRARAERNLRRVPGLAEDERRLRAAVRGVYRTAALNYLDFLRGKKISDRELLSGWTIENQEAFDAAMAQRKGLIILSAHLGNFELGASRLGALGYNVIAPAEHMRPEAVFQLFCRIREHHRMRIVPADTRDSLRVLLESLKRGEVAVFIVDRYVTGSSARVPFFGIPLRMPTAPVALALKSGAPVMAVFSWRDGPGRSHGVFIPLDLEPHERMAGGAGAGSRAAAAERTRTNDAVLRAMRVYVDEMERAVSAHPDQWVSALLPVWEE